MDLDKKEVLTEREHMQIDATRQGFCMGRYNEHLNLLLSGLLGFVRLGVQLGSSVDARAGHASLLLEGLLLTIQLQDWLLSASLLTFVTI
jgi:hypothetical protein